MPDGIQRGVEAIDRAGDGGLGRINRTRFRLQELYFPRPELRTANGEPRTANLNATRAEIWRNDARRGFLGVKNRKQQRPPWVVCRRSGGSEPRIRGRALSES